MVELENKINLFRGIVWGEAKAKSEKDLYDSTERNTENLQKERKALDEKKSNYIARRQKVAQIRANSAISIQLEENKRALLATKKQCLSELDDAIKEKLKSYAQSEAYRVRFREKLKNDIEKNPNGFISIRPEDEEIVREFLPVKYTTDLDSKEIAGYTITSQDRKRRTRVTLLALMEQYAYERGRNLYSVLDGKKVDNAKN